MNSDQTKWMRNGLGPVIFAAGAIAVVMVIMTLIKGMPSDEAKDVDAVARGLVGLVGLAPLAIFGLGAAFVGARLFVAGIDLRLNRNLLGLVLVPLAFAIFLATILPNAGGTFGEAIGGRVRLQMMPAIAFAFGVLVLVAPIWFIFVREFALQFMAGTTPHTAERELEVQQAGGLSPEEADALLPAEDPESRVESSPNSGELAQILATQTEERPEWLEESSYPQAPSPYGEDVRTKGEIPQGAAPLESKETVSHESSPQSPSVQRWAPESLRLADDALGADLADDDKPTEVRPELVQESEPEPVAAVEEPEPEPEPVQILTPTRRPKVTPVNEVDAVPREALPPAPSWEQSSMFEEVSAEADLEEEEVLAEAEELEEAEELDAQAEYEDEDEADEELEDEDESAEYEEEEYEEEDEDDEELDPAAEYEEEDEEELEESAEYEEEEEDEEELDPAAEYEEEELEESAEYEEEDEEEEELDPAAEYEEEDEEELEESAEYEEEDEEEVDPAAEYEEEEEELEESAEYEEEDEEVDPAAQHEEEELELVAEVEEEEPQAVLAESEPEVVLTPQAPPEGAARVSDQVIYDAGVLFLDRERVAVSMLQREFSLDFDESCEAMDRLQSMGLIGPYVGGHRRDILMTKDEWLERVTLP